MTALKSLWHKLMDLTNNISEKNFFSERKLIMAKYVCPCSYVYDEAVGAPEEGIPAGTKFEDIPEDWVCPVCGLGKDSFVKE